MMVKCVLFGHKDSRGRNTYAYLSMGDLDGDLTCLNCGTHYRKSEFITPLMRAHIEKLTGERDFWEQVAEERLQKLEGSQADET